MIKIAFCDDELILLDNYAKVMNHLKLNYNFECHYFKSGEELLNYMLIHEAEFNLLFLDIIMDEIDGMELAKKIRQIDQDTEIVFLTSSPEYAVASYEIKALNYIIKQSNQLEIKIVEAIEHTSSKKQDYFLVVNKSTVEKIKINTIIFIESDKRKVIIHTTESVYEMYNKLDQIADKLNNSKFIRTHRSYLLNMDYIKKIETKEIVTTHQQLIPISRGRADEIKELFIKYLEN